MVGGTVNLVSEDWKPKSQCVRNMELVEVSRDAQ